MKELVEVVAKALVDNPDEVVVTEKTEGKNIVLELHVAASDMGKVIGKQGRVFRYEANEDDFRMVYRLPDTSETISCGYLDRNLSLIHI